MQERIMDAMEYNVQIEELIQKGGVLDCVRGSTVAEVLGGITRSMTLPEGVSQEWLFSELLRREDLISTAVGKGIAIPHPRQALVKNPEDQRIVVAYLEKPLFMNAPDARPVYVMFCTLSCNSQTHLKVLRDLAFLFQNRDFTKRLEGRLSLDELVRAVGEVMRERIV